MATIAPKDSIQTIVSKLSADAGDFQKYKQNPKGFFQDIENVKKYSPTIADLAVKDPASYFAQYDQYLKGMGKPTKDSIYSVQYEGDPSYYRPQYIKSTNEWYDYNNNKWTPGTWVTGDIAQKPETTAIGTTSSTSTGGATVESPRSRRGYSYGTENPYLSELMGIKKGASRSASRYSLVPGEKKGMGKKRSYNFVEELLRR